jgi:prepilin-type N-terminal cleavage/methylation domain-containing protein
MKLKEDGRYNLTKPAANQGGYTWLELIVVLMIVCILVALIFVFK